MRLGPGSHPGAEEGLGGVCSGFSDELVSRLTERTIRTESDRLDGRRTHGTVLQQSG